MKHVLYFTADWCNPCKKVRPIVEAINKDSTTKFLFIDVDSSMDLAKHYDISSIPAFILLQDGKEINRMSGSKTKSELEDFING